jgi:hypothetical protein
MPTPGSGAEAQPPPSNRPQRDSYFGDKVIWTGRPKLVTVPPLYLVGALVSAAMAAITTLSAVAVATALGTPVGSMLLFAAWMATLALGFWQFPRWWRSELVYTITERNIIVQRGRYRRYIDRRAISYARIHWYANHSDVGDLELVRAVPTGALRRRLTLVLTGITAPDRVWAFVRGVTPAAPAGDGHRLLAQRLDDGERVLWSAHPEPRWRAFLPHDLRAASTLLGFALVASAIGAGLRAYHGIESVLRGGLAPSSLPFVALVASVSLSIGMLAAAAAFILYASVLRPARLAKLTRYLITDRRVLIQRGAVELHLDRERIVDVIEAPAHGGRRHLFLVLDGKGARAFAPSGAFGEEPRGVLVPVLELVEDPDSVLELLRSPPRPVLPPLAA